MEQQTATATETKVVIKRTIPNKQKSAIKMVMWSLSQVMEKDAMLAKIVEMFKVTDTIETIIEMVDAVEKSPEYTMMDTELTAIRSPKTKKRTKVTGDPDAIIKQLVDMATTETATGKKKVKAEGDVEKPKKAPRGKKVDDSKVDDSKVDDSKVDDSKVDDSNAPPAPTAKVDDSKVDDSKADDSKPATDVETESKKKAPRAKKVAKVDDSKADDSKVPEAPTADVVTEPKKKAPRAKKVTEPKATTTEATTTEEAPEAPKTPPAASTTEPKAAAEPTTAPLAPKKAPAKKTKTTVESNGTTPELAESAKPKAKAPKAPKTKTPSEIVHPNEVVEVAEDLREDEYMLLNEVEVDGKTYMVDSSQNVYNEFNDVIGKYENGVVTMNA